VKGPRPCPWVSCRYSTFFDQPHSDGRKRLRVLAEASSLKLDDLADNWLESWQSTRYSCVLDVADEAFDAGEHTDLSVISEALGTDPSNASTAFRRAAAKFRERLEAHDSVGEDVADGDAGGDGQQAEPPVARRA